MTNCLANPVVTIPLLVSVGTGANTGYLDFNIDPEDLMPPDEEFWKQVFPGVEECGLFLFPIRGCAVARTSVQVFHVYGADISVPTKAHAKMLIHLLTGRTDLWKKDESHV